MKKEITVTENRILISMDGSMYIEDAAILKQELLGYLDEKYRVYIIDMSAVDYIDAAGLGALVAVSNCSHHLGGRVIVVGLKGIVKELFKLTQLEEIFKDTNSEGGYDDMCCKMKGSFCLDSLA